ncbi:MAG: hypothetical protein ABS76_26310 [Pelagibacterium sp. SCN 64-44]|nr:MAG: hypothetical protein ABS76_26310 [Pelagibacterium sp. SCN 64-44]
MMKTPSRKDAQARRQTILEAAEMVFAEKGLEVPLNEICVAANVGRATLYRNFESRIELVHAIMSNNLDKLDHIVERGMSPSDTLVSYLTEVLAQLVRTGGLVYLINNDHRFSDRYFRHLSVMLERRVDGFRTDMDVRMVATVVNMMAGALAGSTFADRQQAEHLVLDLALRALR